MTGVYNFMSNDLRSLTTKGDLLVRADQGVLRLPSGSDDQLLVADSSSVSGVAWQTINYLTAASSPTITGDWAFDTTISVDACTSTVIGADFDGTSTAGGLLWTDFKDGGVSKGAIALTGGFFGLLGVADIFFGTSTSSFVLVAEVSNAIAIQAVGGLNITATTAITGNVSATNLSGTNTGDQVASTVTNDSGVSGANVDDALDNLDADKLNIVGDVNAQTGTTYTIVAGDNGKLITCSNASAVTVTIPSGLGLGFNCQIMQLGAGVVTVSPSSTTVNNANSHTATRDQYSVINLFAYVADTFVLQGDSA